MTHGPEPDADDPRCRNSAAARGDLTGPARDSHQIGQYRAGSRGGPVRRAYEGGLTPRSLERDRVGQTVSAGNAPF